MIYKVRRNIEFILGRFGFLFGEICRQLVLLEVGRGDNVYMDALLLLI